MVSELGFVRGRYYHTDFERLKAENEKLTVEESTQAYLDGLDKPEKENQTTARWLRM
jgi:hypothetical protein